MVVSEETLELKLRLLVSESLKAKDKLTSAVTLGAVGAIERSREYLIPIFLGEFAGWVLDMRRDEYSLAQNLRLRLIELQSAIVSTNTGHYNGPGSGLFGTAVVAVRNEAARQFIGAYAAIGNEAPATRFESDNVIG